MAKRAMDNDASVAHLEMLREYRGEDKKRRRTGSEAAKRSAPRVKKESPPPPEPVKEASRTHTFDIEEDSSEEEWEEVDIDSSASAVGPGSTTTAGATGTSTTPDSIKVAWDTKGTDPTPKKKRKTGVPKLTREERQSRITMHQIHILCLLRHAAIRNSWANDLHLQMQLREGVPSSKVSGLRPDQSIPAVTRTVNFYESLKYLLQTWCRMWFTSARGLHTKDFNELDNINPDSYDGKVTKSIFNKKVVRHRGSRDLNAQGFVALLRSLGLDARLVVSLQPLDFTSNTKTKDTSTKKKTEVEETAPSVLRKPKFVGGQSKSAQRSQERMHYSESPCPVYWAEVWEPTGQKWVTVDTACQVNMEVVGKGKTRIEPALTDKLNNLTYALAFDANGRITDVTKRYSSMYNARTRLSRLTKYMAGNVWWNHLLGKFRPPVDARSVAEEKYFTSKVLSEGFPGNVELFKGHPRYVLERHLRQDEVLTEKKACGLLSTRGKNSKQEYVYPRSAVQQVKSANRWYQLGRVIRAGQVCKKRKKLAKSRFRLDDEEDAPMYSFDQTEAYVPKPVVDGKVPRNGYGNVDLFTPAMMPPGGAHVPGKGAFMAARSLGIDYVNCVTGFDFTKGRQVNPRIDGVIVAAEYAQDVQDVWSDLQEQTQAKAERNKEIRALLRWRRYITALKIRHRLDAEHGEVEAEEGETEVAEEEEEEETEEEVEDEEQVEEQAEGPKVIEYGSDEPWYIPMSILQPYLDKYLNKSAFHVDQPLELVSTVPEEEAEKPPTREPTREPSKGPDSEPVESLNGNQKSSAINVSDNSREASADVQSISDDSSDGNPLEMLSSTIDKPVKIDYAALAVSDDSPDEMSESELYD